MLSKIFNKGVLKLLGALSIPAAIGGLWLYSEREANNEVAQYKVEQKTQETHENLTVDNYELKEVDDQNQVRWQLVAKKGTLGADKDVDLQEVKVEYFDGANLKMRVSAPAGKANETTRDVKLVSLGGHRVVAEGEGGKARLEAAKVELTKKNQFIATGGVNIEWPGVAKVSGNEASGSLKSTDLKDLKLVGNVHAQIGLQ